MTSGPGDLLLVGSGEVVPVDGLVERGVAVLDESALTGEPLPVERPAGDRVCSGVVNAGSPFDLRATTSAADSAYAGIVRLVREAQASSAPFVRLANRYAAVFLPVTLVLAGLAWAISGDPVRAVAVLVVATPCPLLLAAPVAIVSGLSRAARRGVVIKGGGALERLAAGRTLLLDKTGTLTRGRPTLWTVLARRRRRRVRDFAPGGLPRPGLPAPARVARSCAPPGNARIDLQLPDDVVEEHGSGVRGRVGGRRVAVGRAEWAARKLPGWVRRVRRRAALDDALTVVPSPWTAGWRARCCFTTRSARTPGRPVRRLRPAVAEAGGVRRPGRHRRGAGVRPARRGWSVIDGVAHFLSGCQPPAPGSTDEVAQAADQPVEVEEAGH